MILTRIKLPILISLQTPQKWNYTENYCCCMISVAALCKKTDRGPCITKRCHSINFAVAHSYISHIKNCTQHYFSNLIRRVLNTWFLLSELCVGFFSVNCPEFLTDNIRSGIPQPIRAPYQY